MTPYQKHVAKWSACRKCKLYEGRSTVVLARGQLPCDVLFVGEAPGVSEDTIGSPFVGPAGKLLDNMIEQAIYDRPADKGRPRIAFTNLVACFPKEEKDAGTNEPPEWAIKACKDRLNELILIAKPKLIVRVGRLATKWLDPKFVSTAYELRNQKGNAVPYADIDHPAFILRANIAQRGLLIQRAIVTITEAIGDL